MAKAPQVKVDIAAVDQFTATLQKFRRDLVASGNAAKLVDQKVSGISLPSLGLADARRELGTFHAQATRQIGGLSRMIPGLGVLGGIGSVAGLGELVTRYAGLGIELRNVSRVAGTSSAGMDSMRGSARMLGLSAGVADQAMTGLNKSLADAYYGKNSEAAAAFRQAGIGLQGIAGGAAKAEEKIGPIADFVQRLMKSDPRAAVTFVDKIGLGPEAINLLGVGAERLAALRKEAADLAGITDDNEASSERFSMALGRTSIAADRLGRTVMTTLEPVITPLLTSMTNYVRDHPTEMQDTFKGIAGAVGSAAAGVKRLYDAYQDLLGVFDKIERFGKTVGADQVGKWLKEQFGGGAAGPDASKFDADAFLKLSPAEQKTYLDDAGARPGLNRRAMPERYASAGAVGAQQPLLDNAEQDRRAAQAMTYFQSKGWSREQAAGLVSNLRTESGFREAIGGDNGQAYGIAQWHPDRQAAFKAKFGKSIAGSSFQEQLEFVDHELRTSESRAGEVLRATRTAEQAGAVVSQLYERPGDALGEASRRAALARRYAAQSAPPEEPDPTRGGRVPAAKPEEPDLTRGGRLPQLMAPPPAAPVAAGGSQSAVRIHLSADNMPSGMTPQISTQGDGAEVASVRVRYAMPQGG